MAHLRLLVEFSGQLVGFSLYKKSGVYLNDTNRCEIKSFCVLSSGTDLPGDNPNYPSNVLPAGIS